MAWGLKYTPAGGRVPKRGEEVLVEQPGRTKHDHDRDDTQCEARLSTEVECEPKTHRIDDARRNEQRPVALELIVAERTSGLHSKTIGVLRGERDRRLVHVLPN